MSDNFELQPAELPKDSPQTGQYLKNQKEIKVGNGSFTVGQTGISEWRDSAGNVVIKIDPTV